VQSKHSPLHKAAQEEKTVAVKALIHCGANKDERYEGKTPLQWAAQSGQTATVEGLIHLGADKEAPVIGRNILYIFAAITLSNSFQINLFLKSVM
jgi:ankyrin repeat protein